MDKNRLQKLAGVPITEKEQKGPLPVSKEDPLVYEFEDGEQIGHMNLSTYLNIKGIPNRNGRKDPEVIKVRKELAKAVLEAGKEKKIDIPAKYLKDRQKEYKDGGHKIKKDQIALSKWHDEELTETIKSDIGRKLTGKVSVAKQVMRNSLPNLRLIEKLCDLVLDKEADDAVKVIESIKEKAVESIKVLNKIEKEELK